MATIIDIFWSVFMASEFFIIALTFCYLKREYSKATAISSEKNSKIDLSAKKKEPIKKSSQKNIVKLNETQCMNTDKINSQIGYAQLNFLQDGKRISSQIMSQTKIRIGRDPRNDIMIKERTVSRQQCLISKRNNKFILKNYAKKNITRINGNIVDDKAELKYGDVIEMGKITLVFIDIKNITNDQPLKQMYK